MPDYRERLYARVLSLPEVVKSCAELGFQGSHLICMQGPFSLEMNCALIHQTGARFLVTKDTGAAGGFPEKAEAALRCGCRLVIIGRPMREEGITLEQCLKLLTEMKIPDAKAPVGKLPVSGQEPLLRKCRAKARLHRNRSLVRVKRLNRKSPWWESAWAAPDAAR